MCPHALFKHHAMKEYEGVQTYTRHYMQVSDHLHAPATLPARKESPVPTAHELGDGRARLDA